MITYLLFFINYSIAIVYDFKNVLLDYDSCFILKIENKRYTSIDGNMLKKYKNVRTLYIANTSLSDIPDGIEELTKLEELVFVDNEVGEKMLSFDKLTNLHSLQKLKLIGNKMKHLSECIGLLTSLQYLNISKNELEALPNQISELKNLLKLDISYNVVKTLPNTIGNLVNLNMFSANDNRLTTLCNDFIKLTFLCKISLDNNMFQKIPIQLFALKNLEYLSLSKNQITKIECPTAEQIDDFCNDIDTANKIKQVMFMNTYYGKALDWLSDYNERNLGYYLSTLTYLDLSCNQISKISDSIVFFNKLFYLQLNNNNIKKVSGAIKELSSLFFLDLSCNNLTYLPFEFCYLKKLGFLNLKGNDIELDNKPCLDCKHYEHLGVYGIKLIGIKSLFFDEDILTKKLNKPFVAKLKQSHAANFD